MNIDISHIKKQTKPAGDNKTQSSFLKDLFSKDISLKRKTIGDSRKERFYNQLGILFSSGIDLGTALQIIIEDEASAFHKNIYETIYKDVIAGAGFSDALHKTGHFSDYEYYSIKVGEESGKLPGVLAELTGFFELKVQQRRQLTGALSYPIMVMIVAVGAVLFMLNVVVPMFAGVFQRFGGELPALTRRVLALSEWFSGHLVFILVIVLLLILIPLYLRKYDWFKKNSALLLLHIPYAGKLISKIMHARFCHSTALLTLAQVPLLDALEMVKKMIAFYPFQQAISSVQKHIEKGQPMHEGMAKQKVFDRRLVSITKVGEEVNQVGQLYSKLYSQYTDEVKHMTAVLGNMLEPVMIIGVGVMVMIILIAMYLPLFQLSTTVV